ncbi:MAG: hypothetical protein IPO94_10040 [Saprospiraceae bacterium]|nr:hypothetical protein [Saprospiraceae bacterium]
MYAYQLDNGSYDNCSDVRFEVRRLDGGSCGNVEQTVRTITIARTMIITASQVRYWSSLVPSK